MNELFEKREAVRRFRDTEIEEKKLDEILKVAYSAPSAGNLKAREISVVHEDDVKKELVKASYLQIFISQAPVVLAFFAVPGRSALNYGQRGRELYCIQDATIAASYAWLQAVDMGLSACWVGGFRENSIKEILKADKGWKPVVMLPIGYSQ